MAHYQCMKIIKIRYADAWLVTMETHSHPMPLTLLLGAFDDLAPAIDCAQEAARQQRPGVLSLPVEYIRARRLNLSAWSTFKTNA